MNFLYSFGCLLVGSVFLYICYKDGKKIKASFTTSYVVHIRGYIGSIAFIIMGLMLLSKELQNAILIKEIIRLAIPLIGIVAGLYLKTSKKEKYQSMRKYWLFFVIIGTITFLFRLSLLLA